MTQHERFLDEYRRRVELGDKVDADTQFTCDGYVFNVVRTSHGLGVINLQGPDRGALERAFRKMDEELAMTPEPTNFQNEHERDLWVRVYLSIDDNYAYRTEQADRAVAMFRKRNEGLVAAAAGHWSDVWEQFMKTRDRIIDEGAQAPGTVVDTPRP